MNLEEFENAVDILGILTKIDEKSLKKKYLKLSKKYHPDMEEGNEEKFKEINEAYKLLKLYMDNYKFTLEKEEFLNQFPAFTDYRNWNR